MSGPAGRRVREWATEWWVGRGGTAGRVLAHLLWPAERAFSGASRLRNVGYDRGWLVSKRAPIPVIALGNLTVGGVGKTPLAAWVARRLAERGLRPAIVLRGYGADEVLVHRELNPDVPVYEAPRRIDGVIRAASEGRTVAVLDDAFQHRSIARDLDVAIVAAESWDGPRRLLPRGPWRESITALGRADFVVVTRKAASAEHALGVASQAGPAGRVAVCRLSPTGLLPLAGNPADRVPTSWAEGRAVLAVASLGDPASFASQLETLGADVELMAFPDHHPFDGADVARIASRAAQRPVVVTRKEAVKLRGIVPPGLTTMVLEQAPVFELGEEALLEALGAAVCP